MKPYKSVYVQMTYSLISGMTMFLAPNFVAINMGFDTSLTKGISAIGLTALSLCFFYFQIARHGNSQVVLGSVYGRWLFTLVAIISAVMGLMPKIIIPSMIFEATLALWSFAEVKTLKSFKWDKK